MGSKSLIFLLIQGYQLMKKSFLISFFIAIDYLLFGINSRRAQAVSTVLSISLQPFLSIIVHPVLYRREDCVNTKKDRNKMDSCFGMTSCYIEVRSNEAYEVYLKDEERSFIISSSIKPRIVMKSVVHIDDQSAVTPNPRLAMIANDLFYRNSVKKITYTVTSL